MAAAGGGPTPGTSVFPSIPVGDHASTIALAIFAIVSSPSLFAVQPVSAFSYVKIESTMGPVFPAPILPRHNRHVRAHCIQAARLARRPRARLRRIQLLQVARYRVAIELVAQ